MDKDLSKLTKEELARQIAKNMAMMNNNSDLPVDDEADNTLIYDDVSSVDNEATMAFSSLDFSNHKATSENLERKPRFVSEDDFSDDLSFKSKSTGRSGATSVKTRKNSPSSNKKNSVSSSSKKKNNKKKSKARTAGIAVSSVLIVAVVAVSGVYLYGMNKAKGKFLANTYINDVDVSGKTEKEAYDLVAKNTSTLENITLIKKDGNSLTVPLAKIGYKDNIQLTVSQYFSQQNHYTWFKNLMSDTKYKFTSTFTYDDDLLKNEVKRKILDSPGTVDPEDAYIKKQDDGFVIVSEVDGNKVDDEKLDILYEYIDEYLDGGSYTVDISLADCYLEPEVKKADLSDELDNLNSLYSIEISFDFTYASETLYGENILDWISFDEEDPTAGYTVDEDKVMDFVDKMTDKYDTYGTDRQFNSTSRGQITVPAGKGCYGWWIDKNKTCEQLIELIKDGETTEVEPIYYQNPDSAYLYTANPEWRTSTTDIGNTYCEIDLALQKFWYYKDGKLEYECGIVSGMPTEERNTPGGVYKIWIKTKDTTLKGSLSTGESWATPVSFWNNISTFGIGLHDGTWQASFGGTRYKNYGSHGCINMPYDAAKYVFNNIPMGTPVVCYW